MRALVAASLLLAASGAAAVAAGTQRHGPVPCSPATPPRHLAGSLDPAQWFRRHCRSCRGPAGCGGPRRLRRRRPADAGGSHRGQTRWKDGGGCCPPAK